MARTSQEYAVVWTYAYLSEKEAQHNIDCVSATTAKRAISKVEKAQFEDSGEKIVILEVVLRNNSSL